MYRQRRFEDLGADLADAFQKVPPLGTIILYSDLYFSKSKVTHARRDHSSAIGKQLWSDQLTGEVTYNLETVGCHLNCYLLDW